MVRGIRSIKVTTEQLKELSFIMYFCNPFIIRFFSLICSYLGLQVIARPIALFIIYLPVILIIILLPKKIPLDFIALWGSIVIFILFTYLIHPEYEFWYTRNYYGVWDYVLRPDNGLYAYFFIRLLNNPKKIMRAMKTSAWIMYPYYAYLLMEALRRGYWVTTGSQGQTIQLSYDLSFGYDVLIFALVFLYSAMNERKIVDMVMAIAGLVMIFLGGSRGPLLCVAIFMIFYFAVKMVDAKAKNKIIISSLVGCVGVFVYLSYEYILNAVVHMMDKFGVSSRTLTMLLQGNVADDNGRARIWGAAVQMIKDNPFGYGALGTRHVIFYYHDVGHCHQLFLEILVDFGIIVGIILIIFLLVNAFKIMFSKTDFEWKAVFLIFFGRACQLLLSGTYWHVASFWGCIGIGAAIYFSKKEKNRGLTNGKFKDK